MTRHGNWESVTNNFGTCVFLRTAVKLNSNDHQILKGNLRNLVANKLLVQKKINKKQKWSAIRRDLHHSNFSSKSVYNLYPLILFSNFRSFCTNNLFATKFLRFPFKIWWSLTSKHS
jgi:hypothetical protein